MYNSLEEIERLIKACEGIAEDCEGKVGTACTQPAFPALPEQVLSPRQAYFAVAEEIPWQQAVGRISAEMIAPYPPGIPMIYPGEKITQEIWDYLETFRREKRHIHGSRDGRLEVIKVIKSE